MSSNLTTSNSDLSHSSVKSILRVKSLRDSLSSSISEDATADISLSSSSSSSSSSSAGSVRFNDVKIREYYITLGDNPSCSSGPPISLGWHYNQEQQQDIELDLYEQHREGCRRVMHEMKVPAHIRHQMLRNWDVPTSEIMKTQTDCEEIKRQRIRTIKKQQRRAAMKDFAMRLRKRISL